MSVDVVLFSGRICSCSVSYLFLMFVVLSLTRDLRSRSVSVEEEAPGELVIVDPADSGLQPNDAFLLRGRNPFGTVKRQHHCPPGLHGVFADTCV